MNHSIWIYKVLQKSSSIVDPKYRGTPIRSENVWWQQWELITLWRTCILSNEKSQKFCLCFPRPVVLVQQNPEGGVHSSERPLNEGLPVLWHHIFFLVPPASAAVRIKSLLPSLLRESVNMPFKELLTHPFKTRADPCKEEGMAKQIGG